MTSIIPKDFQLVNTWTPDHNGPKWGQDGSPVYLVDQSTGRSYWNESKGVVSFKCLLLAIGTPVVHTAASLVNVAYRTGKLINTAYRIIELTSYLHFSKPNPQNEALAKKQIKEAKEEANDDLMRIVLTPLAIIGLEFAAIYGIFNPYDGRKLYATIERAQYESFILAPCFQPNPRRHAFGGDPNQRNAF